MGIVTPIPMRDPADYIDWAEAEKILSIPQDMRDRIVIGLLWRCGLRAMEIGRLKVKHLQREEGTLIVEGKGNHADRMPVETELLGWLDFYTQGKDPEEYIIDGYKKKGLSRFSVWKIAKRYSEQAGITVTKSNRKMHPHAFRHSLAIWLVRSGVPISKIQQILRHRSLVPTTYYLQFSSKELSEDYQRAWQEARQAEVASVSEPPVVQ